MKHAGHERPLRLPPLFHSPHQTRCRTTIPEMGNGMRTLAPPLTSATFILPSPPPQRPGSQWLDHCCPEFSPGRVRGQFDETGCLLSSHEFDCTCGLLFITVVPSVTERFHPFNLRERKNQGLILELGLWIGVADRHHCLTCCSHFQSPLILHLLRRSSR